MELSIPQMGVSVTEGELTEWLVEDGASVDIGDPLYNLATDKTESEIEAPAAGVLRIIAAAGQTYEVGSIVAEIN
ncbi:lipoyl domain-containing protein [Rhodococcus sp. IEGM 1366]|uniref:lipoyl domain-containing protein n=1 Tax=Rhodococcus sp. IEGM 1366 TaxID=3082223 RepID=UPI002954954B|nr:lipoyl domain-containing protein [Rhodococcus sp. IEGM 1366]MDV8071043.1 lipoyl domain-containing protein [Rhodococcus sp. IEGM 1366]